MASLITYVSLFDEAGNLHSFGPGHDVPEWARKRITNPQVWDDAAIETVASVPAPAASVVAPAATEPPPQGGPGASRQVWADYAAANGVTVQEAWKRDDIIEACEKAGVAV